VEYESLQVDDGGEGARRWNEAGRPIIPSLVVDGTARPILHISQLADAMGLPVPASSEPARLAWETIPLLRAWLDRVRALDDEQLRAPTESRGRSLRNLTVNVFHPIELLPSAWASGEFPWEPERDDEREHALGNVVAYADNILTGWTAFVVEHEDELGQRDPLVSSPRGKILFSALLDSQREHVAFHLEGVPE
jgi:hypothetical protein